MPMYLPFPKNRPQETSPRTAKTRCSGFLVVDGRLRRSLLRGSNLRIGSFARSLATIASCDARWEGYQVVPLLVGKSV